MYIFVSNSLGDAGLDEIYKLAAIYGDRVEIVFRGVLPGETIGSAIRRVAGGPHEGIYGKAAVVIDPRLFREYGIDLVPAIAAGSGPNQTKAYGLVSIEHFDALRKAGKHGDQGKFGEVREIAEPDLEDEMKRRLAGIDFQAKEREAAQNFWSRRTYQDLPTATVPRVRTLDAHVLLTKDLLGAKGEVLMPAGTRINPFEAVPLRHRLVVFDAADPAR